MSSSAVPFETFDATENALLKIAGRIAHALLLRPPTASKEFEHWEANLYSEVEAAAALEQTTSDTQREHALIPSAILAYKNPDHPTLDTIGIDDPNVTGSKVYRVLPNEMDLGENQWWKRYTGPTVPHPVRITEWECADGLTDAARRRRGGFGMPKSASLTPIPAGVAPSTSTQPPPTFKPRPLPKIQPIVPESAAALPPPPAPPSAPAKPKAMKVGPPKGKGKTTRKMIYDDTDEPEHPTLLEIQEQKEKEAQEDEDMDGEHEIDEEVEESKGGASADVDVEMVDAADIPAAKTAGASKRPQRHAKTPIVTPTMITTAAVEAGASEAKKRGGRRASKGTASTPSAKALGKRKVTAEEADTEEAQTAPVGDGKGRRKGDALNLGDAPEGYAIGRLPILMRNVGKRGEVVKDLFKAKKYGPYENDFTPNKYGVPTLFTLCHPCKPCVQRNVPCQWMSDQWSICLPCKSTKHNCSATSDIKETAQESMPAIVGRLLKEHIDGCPDWQAAMKARAEHVPEAWEVEKWKGMPEVLENLVKAVGLRNVKESTPAATKREQLSVEPTHMRASVRSMSTSSSSSAGSKRAASHSPDDEREERNVRRRATPASVANVNLVPASQVMAAQTALRIQEGVGRLAIADTVAPSAPSAARGTPPQRTTPLAGDVHARASSSHVMSRASSRGSPTDIPPAILDNLGTVVASQVVTHYRTLEQTLDTHVRGMEAGMSARLSAFGQELATVSARSETSNAQAVELANAMSQEVASLRREFEELRNAQRRWIAPGPAPVHEGAEQEMEGQQQGPSREDEGEPAPHTPHVAPSPSLPTITITPVAEAGDEDENMSGGSDESAV
ncbi:hypothetical protein BXZ70DRAFT_1052780 [Cristinia sonorae]|uniref:Uncharacterized protein n=1 Tax=Cristinia sonorae TaxID=1940300 RepID=A0A8K0XSM9_9AGAR|nr:hypothetical protein BXZ70DRAFT_1052780 [Cristinia sonorae]